MLERIVLIMAMRQEAKPLIENFNLQIQAGIFDSELPLEVYKNTLEGVEVFLVLNGKDPKFNIESIGTQSACITTLSVIQKLNPDLLINAGTAGGFLARGGAIGQVYSGKSGVYFHDRRIPLGGAYEEWGLGNYPCLEIPNISKIIDLKQGVVTTGSSLDYLEEDKKNMERYHGELKDMEAASIAMVASYYKTPLIIIKAITDMVDGPIATHTEFMKNLDQASRSLDSKCQALIQFCIGKAIEDIN